MASSRKSRRSRLDSADLAARVAAQLEGAVRPGARVVVGLSGGVDSVVLLDCLRRAAPRLRCRVAALHVNHQLSRNAARWSAFCRRLCRARRIPFRAVKVSVARGDSIEAAARAARYAAFAAARADCIALAQHQDDQAETVLLQLLRGAGVHGLAAMPLVREAKTAKRDSSPVTHHPSPLIVRPLLDVTRAEIEAYARSRRLTWVEDESNRDTFFQRNFLRHEVLPLLARRFPAYRATLARAARHLAEAAETLDAVAAADAEGEDGDGTLAVAALRRLPRARARNLLRHFLSAHGVAMPGAARLDEALRQALGAREDARMRIELDGAALRRHAGRLHVVRGALPTRLAREWRGEPEMALPELGGSLVLARGRGLGISLARLGGRPLTVRLRQGGERLQPDARRPRRSLKHLLQEAGVPPWQRERLPLLCCGDALVWVQGLGVDCAFQAKSTEAALQPSWRPAA